LAFALALSVIRDAPPGADVVAVPAGAKEIGRQIKTVWMRPGTRLGFFSHMGTQFSITTFALLWGVPYLKSAQGLDSTTVGSLLTLSVISAIVAGPILGILTGRYPMRRSWLVLTIMVASALMWTIVLSRSEPSPLWLLTILVVVISVGGPGSVIGFDYARTSNPSSAMGTAQGMVNIGGFLASLIVIQVMGVILGHMGGYTFDGFRVAWMVQYPVWILGIVGVLVTRGKARRALAAEGVHVRPIREVIRRNK
jgi:MFS family permease